MKKCHYCSSENKDTARYCVKCGKSLDKRCPVCGAVLEEEEDFCPACGARLDGKSVCPACGAVNEGENEFCAGCGAALAAGPVAVHNAAPAAAAKTKKTAKQTADRVLDIVRASLVMAFALVMFIMSFMSVAKVSDEGTTAEMGFSHGTVLADISVVDLAEGAFDFADPDSLLKVAGDFESFIRDNLSEREMNILEKEPDSLQAGAIFTRMVEKYNIFKLLAFKEAVEYAPSATMDLWLTAALGAFYIAVTAAFLLVSVLEFAGVLKGNKKRGKMQNTLAALTFASALGYGFILTLIFGGSMGFGLVTILVLSMLSLLVNFVYRVFSGEVQFEKAKLPTYISAGVGAVLTLFVLFFSGMSVMKIFCEYAPVGGAAQSFRGGYDSASLSAAWDALKSAAENKEILGSAGTYIPQIFQSTGGNPILMSELLESALSPAMMGVRGEMNVEVVLTVIGILLDVVSIAFIATLALSFGNRIKSLTENRDSKLVYNIVASSLAVVLLGLTVAYVLIVNETMKNFENITYTAKVSGILIVAVVLVVVDLAQKIFCRILVKKQETNELHDVDVSVENAA